MRHRCRGSARKETRKPEREASIVRFVPEHRVKPEVALYWLLALVIALLAASTVGAQTLPTLVQQCTQTSASFGSPPNTCCTLASNPTPGNQIVVTALSSNNAGNWSV